jgi:hypothetical protein
MINLRWIKALLSNAGLPRGFASWPISLWPKPTGQEPKAWSNRRENWRGDFPAVFLDWRDIKWSGQVFAKTRFKPAQQRGQTSASAIRRHIS